MSDYGPTASISTATLRQARKPRSSAASARVPAPPARSVPVRLLGLAGAVVCVAATAVAVAGAPSDAAFGRGLLELLIVGVPIAAGLYAFRSPANAGFGIALLAIGFAWSLTALGETTPSSSYTLGRLSTWLVFPSVVYLLLAFPDGRIARGLDRVLFYGTIALSLIFFYGTAPLVTAFPPHTLWATCTSDCPANAIALVDRPPAFLTRLVLVREWLVMLLWAGLYGSMLGRWRSASQLQRRAMGPVFVAAAGLGACHVAFHASRQLGAPAGVVVALSEVWTLCIVAVCATFVLGLFRRRLLLAQTLARVGAALRGGGPERVRVALAAALGDASIELAFRDPGSRAWCDVYGRSTDWPRPPARGRAVTTVEAGNGAFEAALIHDVALSDDEELLDGVGAMVLAGHRHEQLVADLEEALTDLERSRRRIAETADAERARLERRLHDGAQQRVAALRVRLAAAEEKLQSDPAAGVENVHRLGREADHALDELRSLAHAVYPATLTAAGLPEALRNLSRHSPIPVEVTAEGVTRHGIAIESAVYFTCVEAVQNAIRHATSAGRIWIALDQSPHGLRFEVGDDGPGFAGDGRSGRGLRNMHDRMEAIGGSLTIDARPGRGTVVTGRVGNGAAMRARGLEPPRGSRPSGT